jgi:hypothetical protein
MNEMVKSIFTKKNSTLIDHVCFVLQIVLHKFNVEHLKCGE